MKGLFDLKDTVKSFLSGNFKNMNIMYNDNNNLVLNLTYKDEYHLLLDYELHVDLDNRRINHANHTIQNFMGNLKIERDFGFETAINNQIFREGD